jgi:hypothetical protein
MVKHRKSEILKEPPITGLTSLFLYTNNKIRALNDSKIFAGIMIIIINISSKFVNFGMSKTMESYLKFNFSRNVLIFAMTWMGTRDIYIAISITLVFILVTEFLMNEDSMFCFLPKSYISKQVAKLNEPTPTPSPEDIVKAKIILEKAGVNKKNELTDSNMNPEVYNDNLPINTNGY